ncbi:hypothetical protein DPMN_113196 [Dreissena polymorpha]|uniref:Uncharacterized protein n=1 Tax=Dreissena polymorpha TaxID=45954 RepID=A0A9D4QQM0_DREPO|nr:hypothetical protein DPMN_113196 [Dreissena polymorpha]
MASPDKKYAMAESTIPLTPGAVGDDDCDYDKDCNADTDNSDDDNTCLSVGLSDVYDSCEEDASDGENSDNDDGDCGDSEKDTDSGEEPSVKDTVEPSRTRKSSSNQILKIVKQYGEEEKQ